MDKQFHVDDIYQASAAFQEQFMKNLNERKSAMVELTQNQIVDLFVEKMSKYATKHSEGTYNRQDPTAYEKTEALVGLMYGYSFSPVTDYEGNQIIDNNGNPIIDNVPDPENVRVKINDVTWGVEFEIKTSQEVAKAYWSRSLNGDKGEWLRPEGNFFEVFKNLLLNGDEPIEFEEKENDL